MPTPGALLDVDHDDGVGHLGTTHGCMRERDPATDTPAQPIQPRSTSRM
ncbi:hypothetical protein V3M61_05985 [Trueperella pyogenes]